MDAASKSSPGAWQPLTFRGVAAFAHASCGRLLLVQSVFALLSGGVLACFFHFAWTPSISVAIEQLPAHGGIRAGQFVWAGPEPQRLGAGKFISFVVDPENAGTLGQVSDIECIFTRTELKVRSMFGYLRLRYPARYSVALNHAVVKPWWGAWRPIVVVNIALGAAVLFLVIWWGLASLYAFPVRLLAFYWDRDVGFKGAWLLAGAALLPGALLMNMVILAYTVHRLSFVQATAGAIVHLLVGWVFAALALARLARSTTARPPAPAGPKNPFS